MTCVIPSPPALPVRIQRSAPSGEQGAGAPAAKSAKPYCRAASMRPSLRPLRARSSYRTEGDNARTCGFTRPRGTRRASQPGALAPWVSSRLIDESSVSDSGASKPQHCAVSGPACRLRCRPTALAPPNRLLRKLLAVEGLPRAARRQARNPPGLRPLGHARPPTRTRRHLGAASHRARYAGEADPDRTLVLVVHQVGVQTQGLPTVCCLCTTQINRTASLVATPPPSMRRSDRTVTMVDVSGSRTSVGLELSRLER